MTEVVIAIGARSDLTPGRYERRSTLPFTIGRGLDCDIIVADAYFDLCQYRVRSRPSGAGWEVCADTVVNPVTLNGRALVAGRWTPITSGEMLEAGETRIMLYRPDHVLPAPVRLSRRAESVLARRPVMSSLLLVTLLAVPVWSYFEVWSEDPAMTAALAVACALVLIALWVGVWAMAGRLLTRQSHFVYQTSVISLFLICLLGVRTVLHVLSFLLGGGLLLEAVAIAAYGILLAWLIAASVRAATFVSDGRSWLAGGYFAFGMTLGVTALTMISSMGFDPLPPFSAALSPGVAGLADAQSGEGFIEAAGARFAEDVKP